METYKTLSKKAHALIAKLKDNCTPETIRENYGDKEVNRFNDKIDETDNLTYQERCNLKSILWQVYDITPKY